MTRVVSVPADPVLIPSETCERFGQDLPTASNTNLSYTFEQSESSSSLSKGNFVAASVSPWLETTLQEIRRSVLSKDALPIALLFMAYYFTKILKQAATINHDSLSFELAITNTFTLCSSEVRHRQTASQRTPAAAHRSGRRPPLPWSAGR